jgi:CBS domain containing-hemolysin-like protein
LQDFVEGSLSPAQDEIDAELFRNALYLKRIKVKDCMVPRTEIEDLDVSESIDSLIEIFRSTGHSRIIITEGNVDNVLGYIHHLQVYSYPKSLRKNVMEIQFVPETMNVNKLMLQFIYDGNTIACVVDEYGGTAGIITLEDILEEIFGEIEDEHDEEEYVDKQLSDTEWLFSGRLEIDYLNEQYENLNLPEGDYTTISGYIVMTSGSIPEQGETLELDGFQFIFEHVSETKIETVHVTKLNESSE